MSATDPRALPRLIGAGPIGFDTFVELALYHPEHGFYARGRGAGRRRDFLTSPEVGPLFGAVMARALDAWWRELGCPSPFVVVDAGAGTGTLARSIRAAGPACVEALQLLLVESSAALRSTHGPSTASRADLPRPGELGSAPVVVMANELLDNLAFRLVERVPGGWSEVVVRTCEGALVEDLAELSSAGVERCQALAPEAALGARIPLQDRAATWLADARAVAGRGHVVVFDYASPTTAALAARPWPEWLRTYVAHGRGGHPLDAPGAQDITCELAVDQLAASGAPDADRSQAEFLRAHGIDDLVAEGRRVWRERATVGDLAAVRARSRIGESDALTDPAGFGAFRVLEWTGSSQPLQ